MSVRKAPTVKGRAKPKDPRGKQHDIRSETLKRIGYDLMRESGKLMAQGRSEAARAVSVVGRIIGLEAKRAGSLR